MLRQTCRSNEDADRSKLNAAVSGGVQHGAKRTRGMADEAVTGLRGRARVVDSSRTGITRRQWGETDRVVVRIVRNGERNDPSRDEDERRQPSTELTISREVRVHANRG